MKTTLFKWFCITVTLAGLSLAIAPVQANQFSPEPGVVSEEFVFKTAPFPSCHCASILELTNGDLLCTFFGGTRESAPDVRIWLSRKPVGGEWTPPVPVADGKRPDGKQWSTGNPVLFQPRGGDIFLFYKIIKPNVGFMGRVKYSSDNGHTWSKAHEVGDGLMGAVKNKPIQLADGTILSPSSTEDHGWRAHVERSTDGGKTWTSTGPLNDAKQFEAIQPTILIYPDGRLQMLMRNGRHGADTKILETWSSDEGKTWTPFAKSCLPNNSSGIDGVTLKDGRQLLVYNSSTRNQPGMGHKGRGFLNVALSKDGIHWGAALVLEYSPSSHVQYSYPSVIQTHDGLVHIVYTWSRKRIKHVVLDPAKLVTTPMPDGKWPTNGPVSLEAFKAFQKAQLEKGQKN